jgi:hypothetical protein
VKYLTVLFVVLLTGCSSNNQLTPTQQMQIIEANQQTKTFEISCEAGCKVAYKDPRDQVQLPQQTNGYDVARQAISTVGGIVTTVAPWAAVGAIAVQGINKAGDHTTGSNNTATTTTTTTTTSTDSTHTPTVVNQPAPVVVNQPAPVVVTQPAPVVVNQPAPVVVTQPAPTIVNPVVVNQPTPLVVDPVIVTQPEPIVVTQPTTTTP